jgi:hypothetical protein
MGHSTKLFLSRCPLYPGKSRERSLSADKPTVLGERLLQREACQRQNWRCTVQRHHEAGEWDPGQPVSLDEASEARETPDNRTLCECRNSRHRDRRHA